MRRKIIQIGETFGYWQVVNVPEQGAFVECFCLGCHLTQKLVARKYLFMGKSKSCGCMNSELASQVCLEKYGTSHFLQSLEGQQKLRETMLKYYGVENASQSELIKKKKEETCFKNYGVRHPQQSKEIRDKSKKSMLEKYNVERPLQAEEIRVKYKQTCLEKYGVDNYSKTQEYKIEYAKTCQEKFGYDHPGQSEIVKAKRENTCFRLYGTTNFIKQWNEQNSIQHSKGELELLTWVREKYSASASYRSDKYELDIFISELDLGIEYNGAYVHSEEGIKRRGYKGIAKNYHLDKTKYFASKHIRTIHIWEHEWKKRQDQVKSFLLSALGKNEYKIGARKCVFKFTNDPKEIKAAQELLEATHIQGKAPNPKYVANVYYNNELISTATFGKHHRNSKDWVLSRFTTKTNYTIQGALAKISKLASTNLGSDIISWADYRLSQGNGYLKAGWIEEELLQPDYFYFKGNKVYSKQSRQKKVVGTPEGMTEHEHALLDGLLRVYDCGKIRFRYKFV